MAKKVIDAYTRSRLARLANKTAAERKELLFQAIKAGDQTGTLALIQSGVSLFETNEQGETPLMRAVQEDNFVIVREILTDDDYKLDARAQDDISAAFLRNCLLSLFSRENAIEITTIFLENGANVNARNNDGDTGLHIVARHGRNDDKGMTEILLKHGANFFLRNASGRTALDVAKENKNSVAAQAAIEAAIEKYETAVPVGNIRPVPRISIKKPGI